MSLRAFPGSPIPEDTVRVARAAFPKGNRSNRVKIFVTSVRK
jgi:hypothetical protein